uniref:DNA polymerase III subunit gamma/tau n=1 Tax=Candidatus Kentrum sp. MB TaxID=2138164 RepID=A0A450XPF9_9GAMM|nr:MAG: DNA polymerase-3 subunit gamma/tau [Candidatus Kentron sp. MB]VFK34640.1 MAG: DNA polymerase-3 subunit gamma/tau [Candidatus Kentron sp. MB]VFK76839.1 MAG: DNA polymerase-3 subunit gamma/tau [Candidatus Kentron sp. MB]
MGYQVLARKWRPRDFRQMVGQGHVLRALINALDQDKLHHAFLFTGTRGVGKTTIARILAKCLNCEVGVSSTPCGQCVTCREVDEGRFVDLVEVDAASRARVDETRDLMENAQFLPTRGRYKVYLIDEVHMFSGHSFNALLKTLEEPPAHVKFLLATTEPKKLPITVLSRCLQFNLRGLPRDEIASQLTHILEAEGIPVEAGAIRLIAVAADGSMRDALSLLEQAISYCDRALTVADVEAMLGTVDQTRIRQLLQALARGDGKALITAISAMAGEVVDFDDALRELLGMLQRIAILQVVPDGFGDAEPDREALAALAREISPEDVQLYYQIGLLGRRDLPLSPDPKSGFEMTILRMLAFRPEGAGFSSMAGQKGAGAQAGKEQIPTLNPAPTPAPIPASEPRQPTRAAPRPPEAPAVAPSQVREAGIPADATPAVVPFPPKPETWPRIVAGLRLTGMAKELAKNCILAECRKGLVCLRLAPEHRQLAGESMHRQLERALGAYWGENLRLTIEAGTTEGARQTPAAIGQRRDDERHRAAVLAVNQDPNVQALRTTFDARIDKVLIHNNHD